MIKTKKNKTLKSVSLKENLILKIRKNSLEAANRKQNKPFSKNEIDVNIPKKFIKSR